MFNASKVEEPKTETKRSYSYRDIVNLESKNLYGSMGKMIDSTRKTSERATFGTS
jgi:hypothetical protein